MFHELIACLPMVRHTYRITVVKWECMLEAPDMKSSVYEWINELLTFWTIIEWFMHEIQV